MNNRYNKARDYVVDLMKEVLSGKFQYHNLDHVLDVLNSAERLGELEQINGDDFELLRIAVLYHDSGYTVNLKNHEAISCDIVRNKLPGFGYDDSEIEKICSLIMATKIPQSPKNHLEEIICDADLDYLGRDDFFEIGNSLFEEFKVYGFLSNETEWHTMQKDFLTAHSYFTKSSKQLRDQKKANNLAAVIKLTNHKS